MAAAMYYLGVMYGTFKGNDGKTVVFNKIYIAEDITEHGDVRGRGMSASSCRLSDPHLADGLEPLDRIECAYDRYGKVIGITKAV